MVVKFYREETALFEMMLKEILYIIIFSEGMMQGAFKSLLHSTLIIVNWDNTIPLASQTLLDLLEDEKDLVRHNSIARSFNKILNECRLKTSCTEERELFSEKYISFLASIKYL